MILLGLGAMLGQSCGADLDLQQGVQLECDEGTYCPEGYTCNDLIHRCVKIGEGDIEPPGIAAGSVRIEPTIVALDTEIVVTFEADETLAYNPSVSLAIATADEPPPFVKAGREGHTYTFTYTPSGSEPQDVVTVAADLVDDAGNQASGLSLGTVRFDFRPPQVTGIKAVGNTWLRRGAEGTVEFTVNEALGEVPRVHITESEAELVPASGAEPPVYRFTYTVKDEDEAGAVGVSVEVDAEAGNVGQAAAVEVFTLDFQGPVVVGEPDLITPIARPGAVVGVDFELDEELSEAPSVVLLPEGEDAGAEIALGLAAQIGRRYTFTGRLPVDHPALHFGLQIAGLKDLAGNDGEPWSLEAAFAVDGVAPEIVAPGPSLNKAPPFYREGEQLVLSFAVEEALAEGFPRVSLDLPDGALRLPCAADEDPTRYACTLEGTLDPDRHAEGLISVLVELVDVAGNTSFQSIPVTLDYTDPVLTDGSPSAPAYKLGDTIFYTLNVDAPLAAPPADAGPGARGRPVATVSCDDVLLEGLFAEPSQETDTSFTYRAPVVAGMDGTYRIEVAMTDRAGNTATASVEDAFSVDSTPPSLVGDPRTHLNKTPACYKDREVIVLGFAANEPLGEGFPRVTLNTPRPKALGCEPGGAEGAYLCTLEAPLDGEADPEGLLGVSVEMQDVAGNPLFESTSVTLDFTPPALAGASANTSSYKAGDRILYTVNVSEPLLGQPGRPTVRAYRDGELVPGLFGAAALSAETDTSFSFSVPVVAGMDGAYTVEVDLEDLAGNTALDLAGTGFAVDTRAPALTAGPTLDKAPAAYKVGETIRVEFTVDEALPALPRVTLTTEQPEELPCVAGEEAGSYACTLVEALDGQEAPEGRVGLSIELVDGAGNATFESVSLVLDFTDPDLVQAGPGAVAYKLGDSLQYTVNVSEPLVGEPGRPTVRVFRDGVLQPDLLSAATLASETNASFSYTVPVVAGMDGTYTVRVDLEDEAGNTASDLAGTGFSIDATAPTLTSIPALDKDPATYRAGESIELTFSVSEALAGSPRVTLTADQPEDLPCVPGLEDDAWVCTLEEPLDGQEVPEGQVGLSLELLDDAGNATFGSVSLVLDFTDPEVVQATPSAPAYKAGDTLLYTVNVSEPLAGNPGRPTVRVEKDGVVQADMLSPASLSAETNTSFTWSVPVALGMDGTYTVEVDLVDEAGNTAVDLVGDGFEVDTGPPALAAGPTLDKAPPAYRQGEGVTVSFTVGEALPRPPRVTLTTHESEALPCVAGAEEHSHT